jgi:hypothetical protein
MGAPYHKNDEDYLDELFVDNAPTPTYFVPLFCLLVSGSLIEPQTLDHLSIFTVILVL